MNVLFNTLLRWGIIASLSDRESFISRVAGTIEQYNYDPARAEKLARILAACLEDMKDTMNIRRTVSQFAAQSDLASKEDLAELNKVISELVTELKQLRKKDPDV
ncbi:MAG: hypothetical protein AB1458_11740 [Bacteroidota bacterium]